MKRPLSDLTYQWNGNSNKSILLNQLAIIQWFHSSLIQVENEEMTSSSNFVWDRFHWFVPPISQNMPFPVYYYALFTHSLIDPSLTLGLNLDSPRSTFTSDLVLDYQAAFSSQIRSPLAMLVTVKLLRNEKISKVQDPYGGYIVWGFYRYFSKVQNAHSELGYESVLHKNEMPSRVEVLDQKKISKRGGERQQAQQNIEEKPGRMGHNPNRETPKITNFSFQSWYGHLPEVKNRWLGLSF